MAEYKIMDRPNEQGFDVNISHPEIAPLYNAYKLRHSIAFGDPMSITERKNFEREIKALEMAEYRAMMTAHGLGQLDVPPPRIKAIWLQRNWRKAMPKR